MSPQFNAFVFTLLMLTASAPIAASTHIDSKVPDADVLPQVRPGQSCLPVGLDAEVLRRANQLAAGDPAFYQDDLQVPLLCVTGARDQWITLVNEGNKILEHVRNASREIQRQVDWRTEATLPDSSYPNELVTPRTVLLNDSFNGHRTGGFGDWTVVTQGGEEPAFQLRSYNEVNGTRHAYAFGHDAGYAQGVHQWLVSPEIDLTSLRANKTAIQDLVLVRDRARDSLRVACTSGFQVGFLGGSPVGFFCGEGAAAHPLIAAYEMAFDDAIRQLPVMQHGAHLDITYRLNMAPGEDGVRMWIYSGDRAPDRRTLYSKGFGLGAESLACAYNDQRVPDAARPVVGSAFSLGVPGADAAGEDVVCTDDLRGAKAVGNAQGRGPTDDLRGMGETAAFRSTHQPELLTAFTGELREWTTARVNLTDHMQQRVWILFEVKTNRDDRGLDIFNDTTRFPRKSNFGFQLSYVSAEGDAYLRNFRLKDVAATYPFAVAPNEFGDPNTTRIATPPGNSPIVAWVHNAGDYLENGTLTFTVSGRSDAPASRMTVVGRYTTPVSVRPDEVKAVSVPWGTILDDGHPTLQERWLYEVSASLASIERNATNVSDQLDSVDLDEPTNTRPSALDPNSTRVRPENAARLGIEAGTLDVSRLVRAATIRNVTLVRADGAQGNAVLLCSELVEGKRCVEHYAGRKGEPRIVLVGVRNDGNTPQDITLDLNLALDGAGKPDAVVGGLSRVARDVLPGEIRPVSWTVVATQPGDYDATIAAIRQGEVAAKDPTAHRKLYVQRSTGLICLDTILERECGPSFNGELVPTLRGENVTAGALAADGTLVVATTVREDEGSRKSGLLASRSNAGAWSVLADLSATRLNESQATPPATGYAYGSIRAIVRAPDASLYLLGDNSTALRYDAAGQVKRLPVAQDDPIHFTSALWYRGTLLAAGSNGTLVELTNGSLIPFNVQNTTYVNGTAALATYNGTIHALALASTGRALLGGEGGVLLRHTGSTLTTGWTEARSSTDVLFSDAVLNRTILSLANIDERVVVGGVGFMNVTAERSDSGFHRMLPPPPIVDSGAQRIRAVALAHDGRLHVLDTEGRVATCERCFEEKAWWQYLLPVSPSVDGSAAARATTLLASPTSTLLLGEAGMALEMSRRGEYANALDWSTVPALAPRDGGVLQTSREGGNDPPLTKIAQTVLLVPEAPGRAIAQQASALRVLLDHHLMTASNGAGVQASDDSYVEVRAVYRNVPAVPLLGTTGGVANSCPDEYQRSGTVDGGVASVVDPVCQSPLVRLTLDHIADETRVDGWESKVYEFPAADPQLASDQKAAVPGAASGWFWGVELFVTPQVRWAIDSIRVQGKVGSEWRDVASWAGPQDPDPYTSDLANTFFRGIGGAPSPQIETTLGTSPSQRVFEEWNRSAFDLALVSPWHVSTSYADKPVFAANNEHYKANVSDPAAPRLLNNWDARLVSPVIDLSHAYDPVITWRHTYSFRTFHDDADQDVREGVRPADGGFVEVQYLMRGTECGSADPTVTCWSAFYPVRPDAGYPDLAGAGYPQVLMADLDIPYVQDQRGVGAFDINPPVAGRIGAWRTPGVGGVEWRSYWGSIAPPDATGRITSPRLTETYVPASVTLANATCTFNDLKAMSSFPQLKIDCLPVNVTGRQIRFAFHVMTAGNWQHAHLSRDGYGTQSDLNLSEESLPGEGWYITDFRVLGAKTLGIDLRATNMTFNVGYAVREIGVGPGTRVPVNVTVENRGAFDVLGYTGKLEVHRVLDRAAKRTELVDTVTLSQQPVLDPKKSVNHTLFWNVPAAENAEYTLRFVVEPIGIDRDEDHLDNVAAIGSTALPILAKTVRRFNVDLDVTPENATSDITRYMALFIDNTGNVPLERFEVERRILRIGGSASAAAVASCSDWGRVAAGTSYFTSQAGNATREELRRALTTDLEGYALPPEVQADLTRLTPVAECRVWETDAGRPVPPGTRVPLSVVDEDSFRNVSADLFWKAPERASFLVSVRASTLVGGQELVGTTDARLAAFATYLFDDVEGGLRGDALKGTWQLDGGWGIDRVGLSGSEAYVFGDTQLGRFAPGLNASLTSPVIDLGSARTANLALFTKFAFEAGFDGGVLEASDDGGKTWTALTPIEGKTTSAAYNRSFPIQATSPIHPDGDPDRPAYGFTSDSALLPSAVDGWSLAQFDLTDYVNVTEADVEYEAFHAGKMRYSFPPTAPTSGKNVYSAGDWCAGRDAGCWEVHNLTQGTITAPTAAPGQKDNSFWWSGSASRYDDGVRPLQNHLLEFEVDLTGVQPGQVVTADWWEWSSRFFARSYYIEKGARGTSISAPDVLTVHTFHPADAGSTYRFNLGEPKVLPDSRGNWYHMQADLTPLIPKLDATGSRTLKVGFAYTPFNSYENSFTCTASACALSGTIAAADQRDDNLFDRYVDDRGFGIDGFKIESYRVVGGARTTPVPIIGEAEAWDRAFNATAGGIRECGVGHTAANGNAPWESNPEYAGCLHLNQFVIRRAPVIAPAEGNGRNWHLVSELPGVRSTWRTVDVRDAHGYDADDKLPTGDVPRAWYTGDLGALDNPCRDEPDSDDVTRAIACPRPGSEARLVTPAFDLSRIAGDNARLAFWHRFAFGQQNSTTAPLASGGVVEISVLDAQTGEWGGWEQIYASEDMRVGAGHLTRRDGLRGGYTGYTANHSAANDGLRRFDPPFENIATKERPHAVQFLYTGNSREIEQRTITPGSTDYVYPMEGSERDGWLREEFDVSEHLGRKVRFAFHYLYSPYDMDRQAAEWAQLDAPDQESPSGDVEANGRTGWWVSDVAVIGDVLVGKPVQLRARVGTDANVEDGHFLLDDIGVFGARYRNNVGIFVDPTPDAYGGYNSSVVTIPVTIRNLGDSVRRDLALEIRSAKGAVELVSGSGPAGNVTLEDGAHVLKGFTLGPGQSAVALVKVHTPRVLSRTDDTLVLQLREENPTTTNEPFAAITNNEVQGILVRYVDFRLQQRPELEIVRTAIRQAAPAPGDRVDFVVTARNPGHGPFELVAECAASTITDHGAVDHERTAVHTPALAAEYPCAIAGDLSLAAKESTELTFSATPTKAGFLSFEVTLRLVGVENRTLRAGAPVGTSLVTYRETFDEPSSMSNFSGREGTSGILWSTRGHDRAGALLLGLNETDAGSANYATGCPGGVCLARTRAVDLHNYSAATPAYLSFWHLDRLARHDGAQVRAQVLLNELRPLSSTSWSTECILRPLGGYEGNVSQRLQSGDVPPDSNPAFGTPPYAQNHRETGTDFFVTKGGIWEETWSLALFELPATCQSVQPGGGSVPLLGRTVRFSFYAFLGSPGGVLDRGAGHGFIVDEISVGPLALDVRPIKAQRANLLDNTTKGFNVVLENLGSMPDVVRVEFDALNSSAPTGSISVPARTFTLQPGERVIATVNVTLPRDPSLLPADFKAHIIARSVLDPNAAGSTVLDLFFGPREWAELELTVEPPAGIVQEATETFIPIRVENNGLVDSVPSRVRIVDEWAGGRIEHTLDLPSMPSYAQSAEEALRVLEFRWRPERGSIGPHVLTFEADPEVRGEEYTRLNNRVELVVEVSDLLIPDLHIANFTALSIRNAVGGSVSPGFDADVARYEVTAGEVVSFDLKVANTGRAGATNVNVRPFIGALSLPSKTIPYIAPGTEAVVTFNWLAQKGEHKVEFDVRIEQVELTSANNVYPGRGVTLLTVKGYEVAIDITPPIDLLAPASEVRVPFRITNNGNAGEDLELRAKAPAGMRLTLPREGFFLRAGETYEDEARLVLDAVAIAGQQFISIDAIARENPMKVASGRAAVSVQASYGGSIAGGYAVGAPTELVIPVDLVNEGNSLEPWKLTLRLPAGWTAREAMPANVVVPAHDRLTFAFHVTLPQGTAPGDRVLAVKAEMPNGEKREGVARVGILPIRAAALAVQDAAPRPDKGALSLPVRVENTGNVQQPFSVLLVDAPAGVEMRVEPSEFLLPPGGVAIATLLVRPNESFAGGTYAVTTYTRFEGVIPQTREGLANVQTLRVPIVRQDLRVTAIEFSPRADLDAGDRVSVKATVQNLGQFEATDVPVHLYVDDVFIAEATVARVAPGGRADVTFNWTAITGVHTLTAVADPYKDTVDGSREDNAASALATVGTEIANGAVAAGRAEAPFGGAWLVLVGLMIAFVVWRRERR